MIKKNPVDQMGSLNFFNVLCLGGMVSQTVVSE